jgi:flagellar hook-length control protein FliK
VLAIFPSARATGLTNLLSAVQATNGLADAPISEGLTRLATETEATTASPFLTLLHALLVASPGAAAIQANAANLQAEKTSVDALASKSGSAAGSSGRLSGTSSPLPAPQQVATTSSTVDSPALSAQPTGSSVPLKTIPFGDKTDPSGVATPAATVPGAQLAVSVSSSVTLTAVATEPGNPASTPSRTVPPTSLSAAQPGPMTSETETIPPRLRGSAATPNLATTADNASTVQPVRAVQPILTVQAVNPAGSSLARTVAGEETRSSVKNSSSGSANVADVPGETTNRAGHDSLSRPTGTDFEPSAANLAAPAIGAESGGQVPAAAVVAAAMSDGSASSSQAATGKTTGIVAGGKAESVRSAREAAGGSANATPADQTDSHASSGVPADASGLATSQKVNREPSNPHGARTLGPVGLTATSAGAGLSGVSPATVGSGQSAAPGFATATTRQTAAPVAEQVATAAAARAQFVSRNSSTEFYVRLEPPELGTVHVHLQASDGNVSARLVVSNEAARAALESQLPDLRSRLGSAGVNVGGLDVSNGQAGSGQSSNGHGTHSPPAEAIDPPPSPQQAAGAGTAYVPAGTDVVNVIA